MSAEEIIAQIDALSESERERVVEHIREPAEKEIPEAFRRGMADAFGGCGVEMETALAEPPPAQR